MPQFVVYSMRAANGLAFEKPYKAFSDRQDAARYAEAQIGENVAQARIYLVADENDAREAIAAVRLDEGILIETKRQKSPGVATDRELEPLTSDAPNEEILASSPDAGSL